MAKYEPTPEEVKEIDNLFTYHSLTEEQRLRCDEHRIAAYNYAMILLRNCPPSPERTLAIRSIWRSTQEANSSIALHEKGD